MSLIAPVEIEGIVKEFMEKYYDTEPFRECVVLCGYAQSFIAEWNTRGRNTAVDKLEKELTAEGKDPYAWVLQIGLRKELPEGVKIPSEFQGLKVYVEWIGELNALKKINNKQLN